MKSINQEKYFQLLGLTAIAKVHYSKLADIKKVMAPYIQECTGLSEEKAEEWIDEMIFGYGGLEGEPMTALNALLKRLEINFENPS